MKSCNVKEIPEDAWKKFRIRCMMEGLTINEKLIQMIINEANRPLPKEE